MLSPGRDAVGRATCERHQPEQTLLYQLVEAHYPALVDQLAQQGKSLPDHVHREFGAYLKCGRLEHGFLRVKAPDKNELEALVQRISKRVGRCLERQGLLERDAESAWLDLEPAEDTDAMPQILGSSVSYRIAVGPQQGRKAFMIRTIRPLDKPDPGLERVAKANGFSLHAGVIVDASNRCIEDQDIIDRILAHLSNKKSTSPARPLLTPPPRAPPETLHLFAGKDSSSTAINQQGGQ